MLGAAVAVALLGAAGAWLPLSTTLDYLLRAASQTCEALPLQALTSAQIIPDLKFVEYTTEGKRRYPLTTAHLQDFSGSQLIVYIPGWWNTPTDESSDALVKALLTKNTIVLILDTRASFGRGYVSSAVQVNGLAHRVFRFFRNLYVQGYPISKIHLIGFSLGAHVAGITGKLVQKKLNQVIERITALDPARPCFLEPSRFRLRKEDAAFVYVLHTSSGVIGLEDPIGHVDVYANGLTSSQPECKGMIITLECDHAQAWKLYSASVTNSSALIGQRCLDWKELKNSKCSGDIADVGYDCNSANRGLYIYRSQVESRRLKNFSPFDFWSWFHR
ncbi:lipase member H-like isoform X1 [Colias croceus]|uniref:lipase member H-like isoform X1 n=1 Tax=Colias crocea TaxID=72248 RepID=UPI001E27DBBA|nr:lipase member H-like isoform X1 [Colias croceus]